MLKLTEMFLYSTAFMQTWSLMNTGIHLLVPQLLYNVSNEVVSPFALREVV